MHMTEDKMRYGTHRGMLDAVLAAGCEALNQGHGGGRGADGREAEQVDEAMAWLDAILDAADSAGTRYEVDSPFHVARASVIDEQVLQQERLAAAFA